MSSEKETLRRVQDGLFHLQKGLAPFVEAWMKKAHGPGWLQYASRAYGAGPKAALDVYGQLKTLIDRWREVFEPVFDRRTGQRVRTLVSVALEGRNATSHLAIALTDAEALRYLDAMHEILRAVKAPAAETGELKKLYDQQRLSGVTVAPPPAPAPAGTSTPAPKLDLPAANGSVKDLKPWTEVALPHPDVLAHRFQESEFAADLFAVDAGHATGDYGTPASFFRITFLTEGLKRVLTSTLQRLAGSGGDPVIGLQTAFGGGKTHTMLAVYHLARAADLDALEGARPLAEKAGVSTWKQAKSVVFVGTSRGPDIPLLDEGGSRIRTLWGYIAFKLAGKPGLKLVEAAETNHTSPGSALIVDVLKLAGPCVILLDEVVAYARQLPDDRFEAFLSFIQALTEAVKLVPGAMVVGSLPESKAEAGGAKGQEALLRLEKVFGRVQSAWLAASGDETYEIIRRRLFQPLDTEGEKARDETVKAFHDLYKKNPAEFPPEAKEARYHDLLRLSYPIHPELFDRLSKEWASLEKFQRTRGVLRFMANVIGVLWHQQARDPLITPARVPISHERVRASVLYPLDPAFGAVVDREVDGDGSLPARMEANPTRRISQARAATRAARAVFLCSAPLVGQPNAGLTGQGLRLACAEPRDQLAIFGEALRELTERAAYLYEEAGRYWFSTKPTLNRLADERAKALPDHEVDAEIADMLREDAATKGGFHRVYAVPDDPGSVDEASALSLVILGPSTPHAGRAVAESSATASVSMSLMQYRSSQRRLRNTLLFAAADEAQLPTAREATRKSLAWKSIVEDGRLQAALTQAQAADAKDKAKTGREGAQRAVRSAWSHVLYPIKTESTAPGKPFDLERLGVVSKDRTALPGAIYEKAKGDGIAKERLGPDTLWTHLKPLWPQDRPHLGVSEVQDWFASYVYLPKLRDAVVLQGAIRDAVAKLDPTFAYADRFDAAAGRYVGLVWAKAPPDLMPDSAVLVRSEVATAQLQKEAAVAGRAAGVPVPGEAPRPGPDGMGEPTGTPVRPRPTRFYGAVEIDMVRPVKSFDQILNAVVMELQRTPGAKVKLTLEVEAQAPSGFAEADVGVVRDNAKQLRFKTESTGFED